MTEPPGWQAPGSPGASPGPSWPAPGVGGQPSSGHGWGAPPGWSGPPPGPGWGPPPGWTPPPPPPQPGVVPLRPLGVGEILDGAFRVVRRHPRATLGLSALATVVELAVSLGVASASGREVFSAVRLSGSVPDFRSSLNLSGLASLPIGGAVGAVLTAMIAIIASDAVLARATGAAVAWGRVRPLLWRLLLLGAVTTVVWTLGLFLLIIPGVFLWGAWALAVPAMALERTGVGGALRRSWRLAVPDWWRVWGIRALSVLLAALVTLVLMLPAFALGVVSAVNTINDSGEIGVGLAVVLTVGSALASALVAPFLAAVQALIYVDRRMRAEALDVTLAASLHR